MSTGWDFDHDDEASITMVRPVKSMTAEKLENHTPNHHGNASDEVAGNHVEGSEEEEEEEGVANEAEVVGTQLGIDDTVFGDESNSTQRKSVVSTGEGEAMVADKKRSSIVAVNTGLVVVSMHTSLSLSRDGPGGYRSQNTNLVH